MVRPCSERTVTTTSWSVVRVSRSARSLSIAARTGGSRTPASSTTRPVSGGKVCAAATSVSAARSASTARPGLRNVPIGSPAPRSAAASKTAAAAGKAPEASEAADRARRTRQRRQAGPIGGLVGILAIRSPVTALPLRQRAGRDKASHEQRDEQPSHQSANRDGDDREQQVSQRDRNA